MELIYLYVQRFSQANRVKGNAFTLSPKHLFNLKEGRRSFELSISDNVEFPPNLFPPHILNVSFLVGSNGSGKTTTLELIRSLLGTRWPRSKSLDRFLGDAQFLAVFRAVDGKRMTAFTSLRDKTSELDSPLVTCSYNGVAIPLIPLDRRRWRTTQVDSESFPHVDVISYTPIFNLRDYPRKERRQDFIDVSSNHLVQTDRTPGGIEDALLVHRRADVSRSLRFINGAASKGGKWNRSFLAAFIPETISVTFVTKPKSPPGRSMAFIAPDAKRAYDHLKTQYRRERTKLLRDYTKLPRTARKGWLVEQLFRMEALMAFVDALFEGVEKRPEYYDGKPYVLSLTPGRPLPKTSRYEAPYLDLLSRQRAISQLAVRQWLKVLSSIKAVSLDSDSGEWSFEVDVRKGAALLRLDSIQAAAKRNTLTISSLFKLNWADMSSGEKMMLDLFSRLYDADRRLRSRGKPSDTVCLVLDEPEQGFHPDWQRKFLQELFSFTSRLPGSRAFQFVIATNNPLPLSDVPGACVEYLTPREQEPQTFAANIHELLGDSFYLQKGFMGEFAKRKLESLIRFLNSKAARTSTWSETTARQVIKLVGDEVIQQRLADLHQAKFPKAPPVLNLDREIAKLKARLQELEQANDHDSNQQGTGPRR